MIPIIISREIPLPIPLSVILSPNHIIASVLDTMIVIAENHQNISGFTTAPGTLKQL